jgi:hypothetical protein
VKALRPITGTVGLVTLGRRAGIVQLPFLRVEPLIATKQKDMYVSRVHPALTAASGRFAGGSLQI